MKSIVFARALIVSVGMMFAVAHADSYSDTVGLFEKAN
jgi:hypothetical protein